MQVESIPKVTVLRICTPLYFANAEICMNKVRKLLRRDRHRSARPLTTSVDSVKATRLSNDGEGAEETLLNQTLELRQKVTLDESREVSDISVAPKCGNVASNGKCDVSVPVSLPFTSVIVLDMSPVSFVDMTAVRALKKLEEECQTDQDLAGSRLLFAGCIGTSILRATRPFFSFTFIPGVRRGVARRE